MKESIKVGIGLTVLIILVIILTLLFVLPVDASDQIGEMDGKIMTYPEESKTLLESEVQFPGNNEGIQGPTIRTIDISDAQDGEVLLYDGDAFAFDSARGLDIDIQYIKLRRDSVIVFEEYSIKVSDILFQVKITKYAIPLLGVSVFICSIIILILAGRIDGLEEKQTNK